METEFKAVDLSIRKILVVEDSPLVRFPIAEALREEGIIVIEAATADEALQHLQVSRDVDLVFTDHRMPGTMTGAELANVLKNTWPALPVIMTSGDFNGEGFRGTLIPKPYSVHKVAKELAALARAYREGTGS